MTAPARAHNEKWLRRYHRRAELRDRYPAEFKRLRETATYSVALRLLEEAHPGEVFTEPTRPIGRQATGKLLCAMCGKSLLSHSISEGCYR